MNQSKPRFSLMLNEWPAPGSDGATEKVYYHPGLEYYQAIDPPLPAFCDQDATELATTAKISTEQAKAALADLRADLEEENQFRQDVERMPSRTASRETAQRMLKILKAARDSLATIEPELLAGMATVRFHSLDDKAKQDPRWFHAFLYDLRVIDRLVADVQGSINKPRRGRPHERNHARLLQRFCDVFEQVTGKKSGRVVLHQSNKPTGSFHGFVSFLLEKAGNRLTANAVDRLLKDFLAGKKKTDQAPKRPKIATKKELG